MKVFSKAIAALLLGTSTVLALGSLPSQAAAQNKTEPKANPADADPKVSKKFGKIYGAATAALDAGDPAGIAAALQSLEGQATDVSDQYWHARYQFSAGSKLNDNALKAKALTALLSNPVTPARLMSTFQGELGLLAFNNLKDYALAAKVFQEMFASGTADPSIAFNASLAHTRLNDFNQALIWVDKAIDAQSAKGEAVPELWTTAKKNLWYNSIAPIREDAYSDSMFNLSFLRLLAATDNMRFSSLYSDYAQYAARVPNEVISVYDQGFASKIIAKDQIAFSEVYGDAQKNAAAIRSNLTKDEADATASANGFLAMVAGDNLLSVKEYGRAIKMYELAFQKGNIISKDGTNLSEKVTIELARARLLNGDAAGAKADFAKLTSPLGKQLAGLWTLYIDTEL